MSNKDETVAKDPPIVWGSISRGFCIFGGVIAIFGGISLAGLSAGGDNSMMEAIANGIGYYCIGKGTFMIALTLNAREAIQLIKRR